MERGRSFSGGWNATTRPRPPRIATVKPVSKSFSEDDLMKAVDDKQSISPRVFCRLKIQDLTLLKKDNLISELEKCLGELEVEHDTSSHLSEVYEKVENERNQLLTELDVAFQDLQEYMQKQKDMEEQTVSIEHEREELIRENEYLKAVLSNRTEIHDNKIEEANRTLNERVKELEQKNTQLIDEINDLYIDRQTLISSLLNLRSEEVDDVIKRRSRNSSIASRESSSDTERLRLLNECFDEQMKELEDVFVENAEIHEGCKKLMGEMKAERHELQEAFKRVKKERDETERELDSLRQDKDNLQKSYGEKIKELEQTISERNEKNLSLSQLKLEKRTIQRQLDHMRETNRASASKVATLKEENADLNASLTVLANQLASEEDLESSIEQVRQLEEERDAFKEQLDDVMSQKLETQESVEDRAKLNKIIEEKANLEAEKALFKSEKDGLTTELNTLKKSLDEVNVAKTSAQKQVESLSQKHKDTARERDTLKNSYRQVTDKNSELETENVRFKRDSIKLRNDNTVMDKQMKNRINTLEIEISKLSSAKDAIEKSLRRKEDDEKELKETIRTLEKQLHDKEDELKSGKLLSSTSNEVLIAANQRFDTLKEENNKTEQRLKQLEKTLTENRVELKRSKEAKEAIHQRNRILESESTNNANNLKTLKIENERLMKKIRQLEKSANENVTLHGDIKQLKDANEVLLKRYRVLEDDFNTISNDHEKLKLEQERLSQQIQQKQEPANEDLQLRIELEKMNETIDKLHKQKKTLEMQLIEKSSNSSKCREEEREKYSMLLVKHDNLCKQYESINTQLKTTHSTLEEKCEKLKHVTKENERFKIELSDKPRDSSSSIQAQLENKLQALTKELETLKENKTKMARDVQYILQSRREEAETVLTNTKNLIEHERDTIKAKYELLRVDCDKMNKEKEHYIITIDTLREENGKLHGQVRKQRLISSSTQDLMIYRLRDDNDTLEKKLEVVKNSLQKSIGENKSLVSKLSRQDESTVTTMRSLKARKNELQLQVNSLTHENDYLKKKLAEKREDETLTGVGENHADTPDLKRKLEFAKSDLNHKLSNSNSRISELETDNREYVKKLKESESLMYELQQALAQANDLAMQKSLEAAKTRRSLEKRNDRLVTENTELKRKVFFTGKSDGEISPTSLFPRYTPPTSFRSDDDSAKNRKVSLPTSIQSDSSSGRSSRLSSLKNTSFEYPMLDPTFESKLQISSSSSAASAPSQQVEFDLSQQLKELMDLTNDLTTVKEDDQKSHASEESMAPPIPPPPVNYETIDRKIAVDNNNIGDDDSDADKKNEDWV